MALEMNDLMALKSLGNEGLSPYEQVKLDYMSNKHHTSGIGVAGLVLGTVGTALAVGSWVFGPMYGNAKASQAKEAAIAAKELANAQNQGLRDLVSTLAGTVAAERAERIAGDQTITQTVNDTVSGSQQGTLTAQQAAELAASQATQQVMQQTFADAVTGRSSLNATPVQIYSAPQPCGCPGCGCNG